jgi:carboxymethylenebutenolidase
MKIPLMLSLALAIGAAMAAAAPDSGLPPGAEGAEAALKASTRHGEYVDVKLSGSRPIQTWVVYPERKDRAPVVLVIHEIFGLSDWVRAVADRLAADGFIAVAPDLLSGMGPGGGGTSSFAGRDEVTDAVRKLSPAEVKLRLDAVRKYALGLPAASSKSATIGFCWGGASSFAYAAAQPELDAAVVYYGTPPSADALANVKAPVLGFYGGDDARVTATVADTEAQMKKLGKSYAAHVYEGAGHGFLRQQDGRDGANAKAAREAWPATIEFLRQHTGAAAAAAAAAPIDDALAPFAFLADSCFVGTFADGKTKDLVCYTWMLDKRFLRSRHRVLGSAYAGETILGRNQSTGKLEYTYYNNMGGVMHGEIEPTAEGLRFPAETVDMQGAQQVVRSAWRKSETGYVASSERQDGDAWKPFMTITFERKGLDAAAELEP